MMHKAVFVSDFVDGEFEGYTDGERWNGWACPRFTLSQAHKVVEALNKAPDFKAAYDDERDQVIVKTVGNGDDIEQFEMFRAHTTDGLLRLYAIGAFCWTWSEKGDFDDD